MSKPNSTEKLNIVARSPFELYFDGEADALSASNRVGNFDVLPGHADFFSMLEPGEIVITPVEGDPIKINGKNGILTVRDNQAYLFVNM
jgi:F0F1-type ATP synthase epsilon subunit